MIAALTGILLGLAIGVSCRWFDIPLPAPPKLAGALLVAAMTAGYVGTDQLLETQSIHTTTQVHPEWRHP